MPQIEPPVHDDTVVVSLRLPASLRDSLAALAERERRSLNGQLVYLLEQALIARPGPEPNEGERNRGRRPRP